MRVAARRGSIVEMSPLAGCSILVLEEQPFVARCLRILLEDAGAEVHGATSAGEALHCIDRKKLSAAVLDHTTGAKGLRRIAQRLAQLGLPFVFCRDAGQNDAWPAAPALIKPVIGLQIVEILQGLIRTQSEKLPSALHAAPPAAWRT